MSKRTFDIFFSAAGLLVLSPLFLLMAVLLKLSSRAPVLFRQQRIGKDGRPFCILKFRSMVVDAEKLGPSVTREGDPRITARGRFLRRTKLDELPQLYNVLIGDMSFVGPRPEVPFYVEKYTAEQKRVLALKPGITDLATLKFRNEEELLRRKAEGGGRVTEDGGPKTVDADTEKFYLEYCVPRKIELNLAYAATANVWEDIKIILRTLLPRVKAEGRKLKAES
jgi:lipopolysaccharide/colanic/teichoic acid biosynthesis glycosyltransferase